MHCDLQAHRGLPQNDLCIAPHRRLGRLLYGGVWGMNRSSPEGSCRENGQQSSKAHSSSQIPGPPSAGPSPPGTRFCSGRSGEMDQEDGRSSHQLSKDTLC
ncbi:hypothetical protein COCON_G00124200 [Conger conger]|uniref:Uncharacterized protein n=1 Tax=Conger conger TaxID=82655 RepID=A0A9Q1HXA6_CONCO|nr:hypothetical protein COCON_G00124200 [Conger conger]